MNRLNRTATHCVLLVLGIPALLPIVWMFSTSLKPDSQVYAGSSTTGITLGSLIPHPAMWSNYPKALSAIPFDLYLKNTLTLCAVCVTGAVISSAFVAYGFARIPFRGRGLLFALVIATMALPGQVTMIPMFELFRKLGWYGSYLPLTVPAFAGAPFYIFLLTQFFRTLPDDMSEAAKLDGAGELRIFTRLVLPLSRPALATCALFQFLGTWNDFMGPLLYLTRTHTFTLAIALQSFQSRHNGVQWNYLMAASAVVIAPIIVLFFLTQKTFIRGIATTGLKG